MVSVGYEQYKRQSVATLTPGEMIVKLYDEAIKRCNFAVKYIEDNDIEATNLCLIKAQDIISYLKCSLDRSYPISQQLERLYDYMRDELMQANLKKDSGKVSEIIPLLKELRDAFSTAEKSTRG